MELLEVKKNRKEKIHLKSNKEQAMQVLCLNGAEAASIIIRICTTEATCQVSLDHLSEIGWAKRIKIRVQIKLKRNNKTGVNHIIDMHLQAIG